MSVPLLRLSVACYDNGSTVTRKACAVVFFKGDLFHSLDLRGTHKPVPDSDGRFLLHHFETESLVTPYCQVRSEANVQFHPQVRASQKLAQM
jgi:hypothetical protein